MARHFFSRSPQNYSLIFLFMLFGTASLVSGYAQSENLYIFATGPALYDPTKKVVRSHGFKYRTTSYHWSKDQNSVYAKKRIAFVGARILKDHSGAHVRYLDTLTLASLRESIENFGEVNSVPKKLILVISAHGGIHNGSFYIWGNAKEKIYSHALNEILAGTEATIELVLLTCHSNAYEPPKRKNFSVFGASPPDGGPMNAFDFYEYLQHLDQREEEPPTTAIDFHEAYIESRFQYLKRTWLKSPYYQIAEYLKLTSWGIWSFNPDSTYQTIKNGIWYQEL